MSNGREILYRPLAESLLDSALLTVKLDYPDGRPLYQYPLDEKAYSEAGSIIKNLKNSLGTNIPWLDKLFVLYAAHWFRRECYSTAYTWDDLKIVPDFVNTQNRGKIVERGFKLWKIIPIENGNGRQWLQTLALNGGIPAKLIADEKETWFDKYLNSIMRDPTAHIDDNGLSLKETCLQPKHLNHLIEGFRDEIIVNQAAKLLESVIGWRREVPSGFSDIESLKWLDQHYPDWRDHFILHVDGMGASLRNLISRLLGLSIPKAPVGLTAKRFIRLIKSETEVQTWDEEVSIGVDGEAPSYLAKPDDGIDCKWDIHLPGRLDGNERIGVANYISAIDDENNQGKERLSLRSVKRNSEGYKFPLNVPVVLSFSNTRYGRKLLNWKNGEALNQDVIVFASTDSMRGEFIGTGTVDSKNEVVWIILKRPYELKLLDTDGFIEKICGNPKFDLYEVRGKIQIKVGKRLYRVRTLCDQNSSYSIAFNEANFNGLKTVKPSIRIALEHTEIQRWKNNSRVASTIRKEIQQGRTALVWKDEHGFLLGRNFVLGLPRETVFKAISVNGSTKFSWSGLPDWKIEFPDSDSALNGDAGEQVFEKKLKSKLFFTLVDPRLKKTEVYLPITLSKPVMTNFEGEVIASSVICDISEMRDLYLHLPRQETLELELKTKPRSRVYLNGFSGESRANDFSTMVKALAANSFERGPQVEMKVWNGPKLGTFGRSQKMMSRDENGYLSPPIGVLGYGVARPLRSPDKVYKLEEVDQTKLKIPAAVAGPSLVYMQDVGRVTTRPIVVNPNISTLYPTDEFTQILTLENEAMRLARLKSFFDELTSNSLEYKPKINLLIRTATTLRGLSPRALDILKVLPNCPSILIAMLFNANSEQREFVLNLSDDLPFLWQTLPDVEWQRALQSKFLNLQSDLQSLEMPNTPQDVMIRLKAWAEDLNIDAPWFSGVCRNLDLEIEPLGSLVRDYLNLYENASHDTQYDEVLSNPLVTKALGKFNLRRNPGLAAPFAVASEALNITKLTPDQFVDIRKILAINTDYIDLGFVHAMKELSQ